MSIILKGINLPKDDEVFYLTLSPDHKVIQMWKEEDNEYKLNQINKIQTIQIPTGHGRLIDADKLKTRLYGYERWTGIDEAPYEYAEHEVYDAPTILEAEGEE